MATSSAFALLSEICFPWLALLSPELCVSVGSAKLGSGWHSAQCLVIHSFDKGNRQQARDDLLWFVSGFLYGYLQMPLLKSCIAFLHQPQFKFASILQAIKMKWLHKTIYVL